MARLTIREAAAMTGLSDRTIRRRIREGALPAQKADRDGREVWSIDAADLSAWAETTGRHVDTAGHCRLTADGLDQDKHRQTPGTGPEKVDTAGQIDVDKLRADIDNLQAQVQALQAERNWLRAHVDTLTRALPAPAADRDEPPATAADRDEPRRPWWRFWGTDRNG